MTPPRLDIVIPVYNEGANILRTLQSIARAVTTPKRVLICYDREDDDTLPAINATTARRSAIWPSTSCATAVAAPMAP